MCIIYCLIRRYSFKSEKYNSKDIQKGYWLCIHRSRQFHFSSCEITQNLCRTPSQIVAEATSQWTVFQEQVSSHQHSQTNKQIHFLSPFSAHQDKPVKEFTSQDWIEKLIRNWPDICHNKIESDLREMQNHAITRNNLKRLSTFDFNTWRIYGLMSILHNVCATIKL